MQLSVDWESWSFHKLLQRNQHTCIAACFIISCIQNELFRQCPFCNNRTCKWGGMEIENNDLTILGYCWLFCHLIWNADGNICWGFISPMSACPNFKCDTQTKHNISHKLAYHVFSQRRTNASTCQDHSSCWCCFTKTKLFFLFFNLIWFPITKFDQELATFVWLCSISKMLTKR